MRWRPAGKGPFGSGFFKPPPGRRSRQTLIDSCSYTQRTCPGSERLTRSVIDMDGVLWHGEAPLQGLAQFFQTLEALDIKYVLATNNPSKRPEEFAEKARRFGIQVDAGDVVTCVQAVQQYLQKNYPQGSRVHVIGERALKEQVEEAGYELADDDVVAVVVAVERGLSHGTFKRGTLLIREVRNSSGPTLTHPTLPRKALCPGAA